MRRGLKPLAIADGSFREAQWQRRRPDEKGIETSPGDTGDIGGSRGEAGTVPNYPIAASLIAAGGNRDGPSEFEQANSLLPDTRVSVRWSSHKRGKPGTGRSRRRSQALWNSFPSTCRRAHFPRCEAIALT